MGSIAELISAIVAFLLLSGGMIGLWIKMNVKVKELDIRILYLEKELEKSINKIFATRTDDIATFKESFVKVWEKLDKIETKIDIKFEDLTKMKAEHDQRVTCYYEKKLKKLDEIQNNE